MILNADERALFLRVFDSLVAWVAERYGLMQASIESSISLIWGDDAIPTIIDDYVAANPRGLPESELDLARMWKVSLTGSFSAARLGEETVFCYGGYAFSVCGIDVEIDSLTMYYPTMLQTTIVPYFDRLIAAGSLASIDVALGPESEMEIEQEAIELRDNGRLIRTPEEFVRVVPLAKERQLEIDAAMFAHQTELEMNADELSEGQHVGVLAKMSWEDRQHAVEDFKAHAASMRYVSLLTAIGGNLRYGQIAYTLEDLFLEHTKDTLIRIAAKRDAPGNLASISKKQLVALVVDTEQLDSAYIIDRCLLEGACRSVEDIKRLVDAGGVLYINKESIDQIEDVPFPVYPYIQLYDCFDRIAAVMPREVSSALEDVDWEAELNRAREIERAIELITLYVNYRGCVQVDEMFDEIEELHNGPIDTTEYMHFILQRMESPNSSFGIYTDTDREVYFIHPLLETEIEQTPNGKLIESLVRRQYGFLPRFVDSMQPMDDLLREISKVDAYRELVSYLDAHVPDGANEFLFANTIAEGVVMLLRHSFNINYLFNLFEMSGLYPSEAQGRRLVQLASELSRYVPQWRLNGWSEAEVAADEGHIRGL